jgi:hypothetical protein
MAAMAWSTVWWMPKTFVSPVIRKILSIRSRVQTRSSEPSQLFLDVAGRQTKRSRPGRSAVTTWPSSTPTTGAA